MRPLGLSLGLGLLTLGRLLYNPCLFYLPAVLAVKKKKEIKADKPQTQTERERGRERVCVCGKREAVVGVTRSREREREREQDIHRQTGRHQQKTLKP